MRRILLAFATATLATSAMLRAQPLPPPPVPAGNPITTAKVNLGKVLFFEEQLSSTGTVACATCHILTRGGSDPRSPNARHPGFDGVFNTPDDVRGSPGVIATLADGRYTRQDPFPLAAQVTSRKSPTVLNAAYNRIQFWDGRAIERFDGPTTGITILPSGASLETQASEPPISDVEMAHQGLDWASLATRLATVKPLALATDVPAALDAWIAGRDYPALFQEVFGIGVTAANICMAIATYERTLITNQSPFDAFLAGNQNALTPQQQRGLQTFNGPGRCNVCHNGPLLNGALTPTGNRFFNIGVRPSNEDLGRFVVTNQPQDRGAFKVPTLRNVGLRAPYFHDGSKATLIEVVDFYNRGGDFRQDQTPLIVPLGLSPGQRADLVAFLQGALSDPRVAAGQAPFDAPTMYTQSGRAPAVYGFGGAGSGGRTPRWVAVEPPVLDNASFTLAITDGLGGAPTALLVDAQAGNGQPFLGFPLQIAASASLLAMPFGTLAGTGAGNGWISKSLVLPASLGETTAFLQALVADDAAPQGIAATAGLRVSLFAPR